MSSENEIAISKLLPNKNEYVRMKTETNIKFPSQFSLGSALSSVKEFVVFSQF
jgi:hypothetical protein